MYTGVLLASAKTQVFEAVLGFLPDWVQFPVLALVVLAVVASWVVKVRRRLARRRASRAGLPLPGTARPGQSGADFLGPYAPPRRQGDRPA
ncbi:hypothetical protein ACJ7VE_19130 [Streptomyces sp. PB17]|uniref:hypothetical protein n=1 Tax=Streptomyces sp. PB17 TaxID=3384158 RepID=UPI0038B616E9